LQDKRRLLGRNPFEKGLLPNHLPKTFNILLQLNFWKSIAYQQQEKEIPFTRGDLSDNCLIEQVSVEISIS